MTALTAEQLDELERACDFVTESTSLDHEVLHSFMDRHGTHVVRVSTLRALLELGRRWLDNPGLRAMLEREHEHELFCSICHEAPGPRSPSWQLGSVAGSPCGRDLTEEINEKLDVRLPEGAVICPGHLEYVVLP